MGCDQGAVHKQLSALVERIGRLENLQRVNDHQESAQWQAIYDLQANEAKAKEPERYPGDMKCSGPVEACPLHGDKPSGWRAREWDAKPGLGVTLDLDVIEVDPRAVRVRQHYRDYKETFNSGDVWDNCDPNCRCPREHRTLLQISSEPAP